MKKTASELSGQVNVVLFCPDDLNLIKEGAAVRRRLLDNAISQIRPRYAEILSEFNKYYENKTRILKDWHEKPGSARHAGRVFRRDGPRLGADNPLSRVLRRPAQRGRPPHPPGVFRRGGGARDPLYRTVSTVRDPFASAKEIYYDICEHQEAHRQAELESAQCLTGAHKDDLEIAINGRSARSFASQGQTRTAALSLKLAEREIFLAETGEYPVLLLDDVLSELDPRRQEFVLNRIGGGQTLITCCEDDEISRRTGGKVIFVEKGK